MPILLVGLGVGLFGFFGLVVLGGGLAYWLLAKPKRLTTQVAVENTKPVGVSPSPVVEKRDPPAQPPVLAPPPARGPNRSVGQGSIAANEWASVLEDLSSPEANRRAAALRRIAETTPSDDRRADVVARLQTSVNDSAWEVWSAAALALVRWNGPAAVPFIAKRLEGFDPFGHKAGMNALAELKTDPAAAAAIAKRLYDVHDQGAASEALKKMDRAVAEKAALPVLADSMKNIFARTAVLKLLGDIGARDSVAPMEVVVAEKNIFYSDLAKSELAKVKARLGEAPPPVQAAEAPPTKPTMPPNGTATPATPAGNANEFAPKNGIFTITMPKGQRQLTRTQVLNIDKHRVPVEQSQSIMKDGTSYACSSIGIPAVAMRDVPADRRFDIFRDAIVKQMRGKVTDEKDILQDPVVGKEYQIETPTGAARMQIYTIAGWVVCALVEAKTKDITQSKQADAFFDSLKLTDKAKDTFRQVKR